MSIVSGLARQKWLKHVAVALLKPGKNDSSMGHLRRISLICTQGKLVEAVLGDIIEREGAKDDLQGGYTAGISVIGRAFVIWTALGYRSKIGGLRTYLCFVDMTAFFDTILPAVMVHSVMKKEWTLPHCCTYSGCTTTYIAQYGQQQERADRNMFPGFRQGGRFSTTAGKATVRRIMNRARTQLKGIWWGTNRK